MNKQGMNDIFVKKEIKDYYDSYYENPMEKWRSLEAISKANNILTLCEKYPHDKILDIGSGEGAVLARLSDVQFSQSFHALEISKSGVEATNNRNIRGLVEGNLFDGYNIPYSDGEFDLAILSHVIEHVEYTRKILYEASRVAKYVFVEVPLEDNMRQEKSFVFSEKGHINFYSPKTIKKLMQTCNLEVLSSVTTNSSYKSYKHRLGKKGFLRYLPKEIFLRIMPKIATKFFTYHHSLLCKSTSNQ